MDSETKCWSVISDLSLLLKCLEKPDRFLKHIDMHALFLFFTGYQERYFIGSNCGHYEYGKIGEFVLDDQEEILLNGLLCHRGGASSVFHKLAELIANTDEAFEYLKGGLYNISKIFPDYLEDVTFCVGAKRTANWYYLLDLYNERPYALVANGPFEYVIDWLNGVLYGLNSLTDRLQINPDWNSFVAWMNQRLKNDPPQRWDDILLSKGWSHIYNEISIWRRNHTNEFRGRATE